MLSARISPLACTFVLASIAAGCSGAGEDDSDGDYSGVGGTPTGSGGFVTGTGGYVSSTGGAFATGGSAIGTGGDVIGTGGLVGTGGDLAGTGGDLLGTGGDVTGTGGDTATGGTSTGGTASTGGTTSTGGTASTGGTTSTGGTASTGGSNGTGTGGSATCSEPSPPQSMAQTIDLTWKEMTGGNQGQTGARPVSASVTNFKNLILDQLMETGGSLNYCVRYESNVAVSAALRDKVEAALVRGANKWFEKLKGHDCFPFDNVEVNITGWATWNRDTFQWPDGGAPIYIGQNDGGGAPQCPNVCSRFHHQQAGYAYPQCSGGEANHFDLSLWLTEGMGFGGAGGDWGQRLDREHFLSTIDNANQHIFLHEFGHGLGFPDYYNWNVWNPGIAAPAIVMNAGAAAQVTDWDGWMLRRTWSELKGRW